MGMGGNGNRNSPSRTPLLPSVANDAGSRVHHTLQLVKLSVVTFGDPANTALQYSQREKSQMHGRVLLLTPHPRTAGHDEFA